MSIPPVEKEVVVDIVPSGAFLRFTSEIAGWWPLDSHTLFDDRLSTCMFEPVLNGRIFETAQDGEEGDWGRVTLWEPWGRVGFTWHPGRDPESAQDVVVTFEPEEEGRCRVRLVHSGWERLGDEGPAWRDRYQEGWDPVLETFRRALIPPEPLL